MAEVGMWMRYLVLGVLKWSYCPVVNEILDLMTKAVATIGAMAALLMIYTVFAWVMFGREWIWQRLRIKGFEMPSFPQDFECAG